MSRAEAPYTPEQAVAILVDLIEGSIHGDEEMIGRALDGMDALGQESDQIMFSIAFMLCEAICQYFGIEKRAGGWPLGIDSPDGHSDLAMTNAMRMVSSYANDDEETTAAILEAALSADDGSESGAASGRLFAALLKLVRLGHAQKAGAN